MPVSGEAGIGKSRIAVTVSERLASEPHTRLRYQCSPYHTNSVLYPFISQLERVAGIRPDDPGEQDLDKLEAVLALGAERVAAVAPLFAALLSIPFGERYAPLMLSPAQQRRQTLAALLDQLEALAQEQPVLVLFEDAHWADATSLELLDLMADRVRHLPLLAIITARPGLEPAWAVLSNVTTLALGRLDQSKDEIMIDRLAGGRRLPAEIMREVIAKTDGVPLFVEELTKTVLEAGILVAAGDGYRLDGPLPPLAIPATLHDSLMARLDRLAPVKEIAQVGAAIGREFSYALLRLVVGREEASLLSGLAQLEQAELLFRRGEPPDAVYIFKHALVQDAAYESLLKSQRQILHRRIAEALSDRFPAIAETEPEVVAHHFAQANLARDAVEWWVKAGERALERSAYDEAIAQLKRAMGVAQTLANEPALLLLRLQTIYGHALFHVQGMTSPDANIAFKRARELAAGVEDPVEKFSAYYGLWAGSWVRAELEPMREIAEASLKDALRYPHSSEASVAHRMVGTTYWFAGDYTGARTHFELALGAYDRERDRCFAAPFGYDVGVVATINLALMLWPLGELSRACSVADEGVRLAVESEHVPTKALLHALTCCLAAIRRKPDEATEHATAALDLADKHGLPVMRAVATFYRGWSLWHAGDPEGRASIYDGLAGIRELQIRVALPFYATLLAEIEAAAGHVEAGLGMVEAELRTIGQSGERWFEAEMHRIRGELLLRHEPTDPATAEAAYNAAIETARCQQTRSFELRAALSLARLFRVTDRVEQIPHLLEPALIGFTDALELPEVDEAKRLLAELGPAR